MSEMGNCERCSASKRSKEADLAVSKRTQKEDDVKSAYKELKGRHGETWDMPHLKLQEYMMIMTTLQMHLPFRVQHPSVHGKSLLVRQLAELQ